MIARDLRCHRHLSLPVETLLRDAVNRLGLSARTRRGHPGRRPGGPGLTWRSETGGVPGADDGEGEQVAGGIPGEPEGAAGGRRLEGDGELLHRRRDPVRIEGQED